MFHFDVLELLFSILVLLVKSGDDQVKFMFYLFAAAAAFAAFFAFLAAFSSGVKRRSFFAGF